VLVLGFTLFAARRGKVRRVRLREAGGEVFDLAVEGERERERESAV
jgi:hypothetical protein